MSILCVVGTRPEAIKMAPLILELKATGNKPFVMTSGQHDIAGELASWGITVDRALPIQRGAMECISRVSFAVRDVARRMACVIAQGDTTTAFAAANAAFLLGRPFVHVEAGLRTYDMNSPFPEEYHRRCITLATTLHCAPTRVAAANLRKEQIDYSRIIITGNTVIDALKLAISTSRHDRSTQGCVLLTSHRFENRDKKRGIVAAAIEISKKHRVIYIEHGNPRAALRIPETGNYIDSISPRSYSAMATLLSGCKAILTDSGGLQEEACFLKKPTVVLRDSTERPEAVEYGTSFIGGTKPYDIVAAFEKAMAATGPDGLIKNSNACPYGDGRASNRIVEALSIFK